MYTRNRVYPYTYMAYSLLTQANRHIHTHKYTRTLRTQTEIHATHVRIIKYNCNAQQRIIKNVGPCSVIVYSVNNGATS